VYDSIVFWVAKIRCAHAIKNRVREPAPPFVTLDNMHNQVERLREAFRDGITRSVDWRLIQLVGLRLLLKENAASLKAAVKKDLGRPDMEINLADLDTPIAELDFIISHLLEWTRPKKVPTSLLVIPATSYVYPDPLGVVCIISPWNYPINLSLVPLFGALAAGNCVMLKMARRSPHTSKLLADLLPRYVDMRCLAIEPSGGAEVITALLQEQFDHIFFTGSPKVGKVVYEAASKNLTPVVLELGGKNPCIVDRSANLHLAAKRIVWGKFFNAGQTCIAPDYVLVHKSVEMELLKFLAEHISTFFGPNPYTSTSFGRIISRQDLERLVKLLSDGKIVCGGSYDPEHNYIEPTVLHKVELSSAVMAEEIFGPILPVIPYSSLNEALKIIHSKPHPLALYVFTTDEAVSNFVLENTASGGACVNDTIVHFGSHYLPFGGVGGSGVGKYHGKKTFTTFINKRAVVYGTNKSWLDIPLRYAPYTKLTVPLVHFLAWLDWKIPF